MYTTLPAFILGFHGCDRAVADAVVCGREELRASENDYDWLGHGSYFWENDPHRALAYARLLQAYPNRGRVSIDEPAVLGAVIDPGHCLNLMESAALSLLREAYEALCELMRASGNPMPINSAPSGTDADLLLRRLECAVIELLHEENAGRREFDTVRGLFFEGHDLYPNAGFKAKNHIQLCVRNPNCIKGYFLPRLLNARYPMP